MDTSYKGARFNSSSVKLVIKLYTFWYKAKWGCKRTYGNSRKRNFADGIQKVYWVILKRYLRSVRAVLGFGGTLGGWITRLTASVKGFKRCAWGFVLGIW